MDTPAGGFGARAMPLLALGAGIWKTEYPMDKQPSEAALSAIRQTKQLRKDLDEQIQNLRKAQLERNSRERSLTLTKLQEAVMWLGMDLKAIDEANPGTAPNPYPESKNPDSPRVEPTSEGLKL